MQVSFSSVSSTSLVLLMALSNSGYLRRETGGGDTNLKKCRLFVCCLPYPICGKYLDSAHLRKGCEYAVYCVHVFFSCVLFFLSAYSSPRIMLVRRPTGRSTASTVNRASVYRPVDVRSTFWVVNERNRMAQAKQTPEDTQNKSRDASEVRYRVSGTSQQEETTSK